ncbi:MAG: MurR/RpiR family transcriptional regulator [Acidimicrobiales bacterium]
MTVADRIDAQRDVLPGAERRVATAVLADPEGVAFGTVAVLAARANTSGATVVRFARRVGYDGFVELQSAVQEERLRRAADLIRQPPPSDVVGRTLAVETDNLRRTLDGVDPKSFRRAIELLAARRRKVYVLTGDASHGVASLFAEELGMLRPGVELVAGSGVSVGRCLAHVGPHDVAVLIDIRRYEREIVAQADEIRRRGASIVAVTDSSISPLTDGAVATFVVTANGAGPFDSHVGILALLNAVVSAVAARLRRSATNRLDRIETAWEDAASLLDV